MKYILIASTLLLMMSCQSEEVTESETASPEETVTEEVKEGLYLNNDQKWKVPEDMMWEIQSQKDKVFEYQMAADTTYIQLGQELDSLCKELVTICTMEGESHNVLHEWLLPHWELIDEINAAANAQDAQSYLDELGTSFETFDIYFE
jgi:hypothetical protein